MSGQVILTIDRSVPTPHGPDQWFEQWLHPDIEQQGPPSFDLAEVEEWRHPGQKDGGTVSGELIYDRLQRDGLLGQCLNKADALAIKELGVEAFERRFRRQQVYFWKSILRWKDGAEEVPYLTLNGGGLRLFHTSLRAGFNEMTPALRFPK